MKQLVKQLLASRGWELVNARARDTLALADLTAADAAIVRRVDPFTLTTLERRATLIQAIDRIVRLRIPGDIVECGVWRGGSTMIAALALMARGDTQRQLYLYDTYEGMSEPTDADRGPTGESAQSELARTTRGTGVWCEAGLDDVQANLFSTGYPRAQLHFVQGKVEDTIPATMPAGDIALLRLDTDWYESTRHELQHLYPRLRSGGVLLIDDYGHWQGARQAVDEYFADQPELYLHRVDYSARLLIKP